MLTVLFQCWFRLINHEFSLSQLTHIIKHSHTTWSLSLNEQSKLSFTTHSFIPNVELGSSTAHTVRHSHFNQHELKHAVTHTFTHAQREA